MLRTALLWGNTINLDSDYSKYIETVSDPWVIEGFAVEGGKVKPGKAWVKVTRSNGESLFVLVQNTQDIPVSLNGDVFIGIEVAQNAIDNGLMNNEDGTGIASIKVWPQKPNQNYLLLAVWQGGRLSDKREIIPKLQSLSTRTSTLEEKVKTSETKVAKLEDKWTPQYLGKFVVVGEAYQAGDVMVEKNWRLTKEIYTQRINGVNNLEVRSNKHLLWELAIPQWATITILVKGMGNSWDRFAWRFSIEHKRTGGGLRPDIKYFDLPPRGQKSNGSVEYYEDQGTTLCFYVSGASETVYATIESIEVTINRNSGLMKFYPREVKGSGERVECTIMGLHSNGDLIQPKPVEIVLGKEMSGTFDTLNWLIEQDQGKVNTDGSISEK